MSSYSIAEARNGLPRLIDKALAGEGVTITRHGKPVAEIRSIPVAADGSLGDFYAWLEERRKARPIGAMTSALLIREMRDEGFLVRALLDASVIVPLFVDEAGSAAAHAFASEEKSHLFVSSFARLEVASAVAKLHRRAVLNAPAAHALLLDFDAWIRIAATPLPTLDRDIERAEGLIRNFASGLRVGDAIHLAIAAHHDLVLVTDDALLRAAAASTGVTARSAKA